jgi:hypothetical protein
VATTVTTRIFTWANIPAGVVISGSNPSIQDCVLVGAPYVIYKETENGWEVGAFNFPPDTLRWIRYKYSSERYPRQLFYKTESNAAKAAHYALKRALQENSRRTYTPFEETVRKWTLSTLIGSGKTHVLYFPGLSHCVTLQENAFKSDKDILTAFLGELSPSTLSVALALETLSTNLQPQSNRIAWNGNRGYPDAWTTTLKQYVTAMSVICHSVPSEVRIAVANMRETIRVSVHDTLFGFRAFSVPYGFSSMEVGFYEISGQIVSALTPPGDLIAWLPNNPVPILMYTLRK